MKEIMEKIPKNILNLLLVLTKNGHEAYIVGGAIRDLLMDKVPKDFDICTSATTNQLKEIFPNHYGLGEKFGTIVVEIDGEDVEITTFRKDSTYSDGRHPDSVEFSTSLKEDLSRRDMTINAIAFSNQGLVDPFGGLNDIKNKVLRAVGDPKKRFQEDGLRIVRALRFSSCLGFEIEEETKKAMVECKDNLKSVSMERFSSELIRILKGKNLFNTLRSNVEVISMIIPEYELVANCPQQNPYHIYNVLDHTLKVVEGVPEDDVLRLSAFFHDFGKPVTRFVNKKGFDSFHRHAIKSEEMALEIMKRLKFDNKTIKEVCLLVKYHDSLWSPTESGVKRLIGTLGLELFDKLTLLRTADIAAQAKREDNSIELSINLRDKIVLEQAATKVSELEIDGFDIMRLLEIKPCKLVGEIITELLDMVIDGKCENVKEKLELEAQKLYQIKK